MIQNQVMETPAGGLDIQKKEPPFWMKLFGTELALWGLEAGTLAPGFLGRSPYIHPFLAITFDFQKQLDEKEIRSAIAALKTGVQQGWRFFNPYEYNTIVAATDFMDEFIRCQPLINPGESPDEWIKRTEKMQIAYAKLRQFKGFREFLSIDLPAWLEKHDKMVAFGEPCRKVMNTIARYDSRRPRLVDTILSWYSLKLGNLIKWKDLTKGWEIQEPSSNRYNPPDSVKPVIDEYTTSLRSRLRHLEAKLQELSIVSNDYLKLDPAGNLKIENISSRINALSSALKGTGISEAAQLSSRPHAMLFFMLKDFDVTYRPLLSGVVRVQSQDAGATFEDVFICKPDIFRGIFESLQMVLSAADRTVRKYKELNDYNFTQFAEDATAADIQDQLKKYFIDIVHRSVVFYRKLGEEISKVIDSHRLALKEEWSGRKNPDLIETYKTPIETIEGGMRYLPFYDRALLVNSRARGIKVEDALRDLLIDTYRFRYLFMDKELHDFLHSEGRFKEQIEEIKQDLTAL